MMSEGKINLFKFWAAMTVVASIIGITYVHGFIYTRAEGTTLENRVITVEDNLISAQQKLGEVSGKIDTVIMLLEKK